jgi:hypothetical protein
MKKLIPLTLFVGLGLVAQGQEKKEAKPPVGMALTQANGFEVGKDFAADARKAVEKYTPQPAPKDRLGGRAVVVRGVVARVERQGIQLASGNEWNILLEGTVKGTGPYASITVKSVSLGVGSKLVLLKGDIERSETPFDK